MFENGFLVAHGDEVFENNAKVSFEPGMPELSIGVPVDTLDGYTKEIQYFVSRLESGEPFDMVSAESSLGTVELCRELIERIRRV